MAEIAEPEVPRRSLLRRVMLPALAVLCAGAGFGASYSGTVSPGAFLARKPAVAAPSWTHTELPRMTVPLAGGRDLHLAITLESPMAAAPALAADLPRIADSYNRFLANIDAAAFSRRGVLEIIREELLTRAQAISGAAVVEDILITEFAIQ
ncbi:MAG: flagellar basal body-associated FliL family protein [Paracoccus sp. (in: a-proteobacteria)]|nr:flagellar basal body-associated FliL family protein [Paracoccus sp. (in: a-proteobacteria)]